MGRDGVIHAVRPFFYARLGPRTAPHRCFTRWVTQKRRARWISGTPDRSVLLVMCGGAPSLELAGRFDTLRVFDAGFIGLPEDGGDFVVLGCQVLLCEFSFEEGEHAS